MGNDLIWNEVDEYFIEKLIPFDSALERVLHVNKEEGLPEIDVAPTQGKLLYLLAKIKGAKNILEIGTLGGYSTIWLARALPEDGKVYTLEAEEEHAKIAERNIKQAGCQDKVEVIVGKALDTLPNIKEKGIAPFDLIFIDADKPNNPHYLKWALELAMPGAIIIADNVVRDGEVINETSEDERVQGIRQFISLLENEPGIESTALQTVGSKGYDGFVISVVK
ncbi:O-methyltransferase [Viridibacillus arvi]|uniref:O-methyltransferase n=1 Tax=Viridibacillus arvi TaxID=263475 RepID=UPI00369B4679